MAAVFDQRFVTRIEGPNVKKGSNKMDLAEGLIEDIRNRGMHLTPEAPTYSMRAHGGLPAYAGGV